MSFNLLSIIIPIYNEDKIVADSLPPIFNLNLAKEIIIVNDGSTDQTLEILNSLNKKYDYTLINQITNQGKGAAIKRGLQNIKGDYFIICDADLEYSPDDIIRIWEAAKSYQSENGNKNIAFYGSRFLNKTPKSFHSLVNWGLTFLTNLLFNSHLSDMETCFKLVPASALEKINLKGNRFEIEPEITAQLLKNGYQIKEISVSYNKRGYKEGKKIKARDGFIAIKTLLKERFN
jgi:glycosyltransferase involved in cell wall biosynthesis